MYSRLANAVEYFIPANLKADNHLRHRYQLYIQTCMALVVVLFFVQLSILLASSYLWKDIALNLGFTIPIQLGLIASAFYFRATGKFKVSVTFLLSLLFLTIVIAVFSLGGPLGGTAVLMLFVPPILAFVLLGSKFGIFWMALTYLALMVGGLMELNGFDFPYIDNSPHPSIGKMIHLNVSFFSVFIMVAFYERTNEQYRRDLEQIAQNDDLTKLPNRRSFYTAVDTAIAAYQLSGTPFTLLYIDLDEFKPINDQYGHNAGDLVLQVFAARLRVAVRNQDFVGRLGGDEFAVLLYDCADSRIAQLMLDRLNTQIAVPFDLRSGQTIVVRASTGMAIYPHDAESLEAILQAADENMYRSKRETGLS